VDKKKMKLHETLEKAIAEGMDAAGVERLRAELKMSKTMNHTMAMNFNRAHGTSFNHTAVSHVSDVSGTSTAVDGVSPTRFNDTINALMSSPVISPSPKVNSRVKLLCRNRECLNDVTHCATRAPILYCSKACQYRGQKLRQKKVRHENKKKIKLHETLEKAIAEGMDAAGVERLRAELNEQMKRL
jgi:muconolactone delta-isomerase